MVIVDRDTKHDTNGLRSLVHTEQLWHRSEDGQSVIYNTPFSTGKTLDARQGKLDEYQATCGIVSCVNILRLAGRTMTTEEELVQYASTAVDGNGTLCTSGKTPLRNGGTTPQNRKDILAAFGMESELHPSSVDSIAQYIEDGRGVIISVDAGKLWNNSRYYGVLHAVTVTSVQRSKNKDGAVEGFYLCDSGTLGKDCAQFYSAVHLGRALTARSMNVTTSIIR